MQSLLKYAVVCNVLFAASIAVGMEDLEEGVVFGSKLTFSCFQQDLQKEKYPVATVECIKKPDKLSCVMIQLPVPKNTKIAVQKDNLKDFVNIVKQAAQDQKSVQFSYDSGDSLDSYTISLPDKDSSVDEFITFFDDFVLRGFKPIGNTIPEDNGKRGLAALSYLEKTQELTLSGLVNSSTMESCGCVLTSEQKEHLYRLINSSTQANSVFAFSLECKNEISIVYYKFNDWWYVRYVQQLLKELESQNTQIIDDCNSSHKNEREKLNNDFRRTILIYKLTIAALFGVLCCLVYKIQSR